MKKFLIVVFFATAVFNSASAQTSMAPSNKTMTKQEKVAAKAKKEADLLEAFTKAGLTADEQQKARAALEESNEKIKSIKADASLSDEDKKTKMNAIYKERNNNLKTMMGEATYKVFKATQKAQKEAMGTNAVE
ncbi:MAG: hypothetical protein LH615_11035 [Ferruginibacter sp.]|nr:hypothetical protein [Ferruginibacter sp.]